uniref:helix-turn-helix domain-containing protein n=1 Tax=Paenibacillus sp. FSL K6-3182 TaxID=2921495 RepID=UPI00403FB4A7
MELKLGGKTKREIIKELGIEDEGQIKKWMRKYKQLGEYRLKDNRGRRMQDV